jgi:multicomponent Na+:H+ antiporter subunit E
MIRRLFKTLIALLYFIPVYLWELILSNLRIAREVITPGDQTHPGFIEIEIEPASDTAALAYCNLLAMTPGSLTVDLSPDRRKVIVHAMYLDDPEAFRADLERTLEAHLRRFS